MADATAGAVLTLYGIVTGIIAAGLVTLGWGFAFDQIGFDAWLLGSLAALLFGALVGLGCALPIWISDDVNAGRHGAGLPVIALVLGALAGLSGDVAAVMLRAPGTMVDLTSVLVFAEGRGVFEWMRAFIAAGAAAAACHRAIESKHDARRAPR